MQSLRIARLTHSPYTTQIARVRCYTTLRTIFKCKDVQHTINVYIKQQDPTYNKCVGGKGGGYAESRWTSLQRKSPLMSPWFLPLPSVWSPCRHFTFSLPLTRQVFSNGGRNCLIFRITGQGYTIKVWPHKYWLSRAFLRGYYWLSPLGDGSSLISWWGLWRGCRRKDWVD